ncbi:hypothetical protein HanRHA438_Chr01g0007181 [Helianthus annuus]|nr:hypothetical protein HanRHA438_Chr01g0007181 [Helianthus annuus]KAJ0955777.1 hypothetical protein HanPSC8_Chr01g0006781 [Helianthus annuus]
MIGWFTKKQVYKISSSFLFNIDSTTLLCTKGVKWFFLFKSLFFPFTCTLSFFQNISSQGSLSYTYIPSCTYICMYISQVSCLRVLGIVLYQLSMTINEAPTWADQWGAGGIGAIGEYQKESIKENDENKTVFSRVAKERAKKLIKWIKNICQNKNKNKSKEYEN